MQASTLIATHGHDPGGALYAQFGIAAPAGAVASASSAISATAVWVIVAVVTGAAVVSSWLVIRRRQRLAHRGCEYSAAGC